MALQMIQNTTPIICDTNHFLDTLSCVEGMNYQEPITNISYSPVFRAPNEPYGVYVYRRLEPQIYVEKKKMKEKFFTSKMKNKNQNQHACTLHLQLTHLLSHLQNWKRIYTL